jgi:excisionase family DNA binding protein
MIAPEAVAQLPTLCTIAEAAAFLRVSTRDIRRKIACGRLRAARLVPGTGSSRVLIPRVEIQDVVAEAFGEVRR